MNELTNILTETANRLLRDHSEKEVLQQAECGTWPEALWQALEENGLTQPLVSEEQGGVGASWQDAFVITYAAGYWRAPVPLPETIASSWLLSRAGLDVPLGPLTLVDVDDHLELSGSRISGEAGAVPWGSRANQSIVTINAEDKWQIVALAHDSGNAVTDFNIAREPRDCLTFDGANCDDVATLPVQSDISPARLLGALVRSSQMAGAMERAVEMAVAYAGEREQFGRPISKFQAIQQMLAIAAAKSVEARMATEIAFRAMDRAGDDLRRAEPDIAAAKVVCGEAVETITDITHQVHGAIGFTYEHELHFTTRRLWSWRGEFGAEAFWAERLGRVALERGALNLWPDLTARQRSEV